MVAPIEPGNKPDRSPRYGIRDGVAVFLPVNSKDTYPYACCAPPAKVYVDGLNAVILPTRDDSGTPLSDLEVTSAYLLSRLHFGKFASVKDATDGLADFNVRGRCV